MVKDSNVRRTVTIPKDLSQTCDVFVKLMLQHGAQNIRSFSELVVASLVCYFNTLEDRLDSHKKEEN